ncbi:kinesin motor domain-containing protein, partial [Lipomyces orientalis]
YDETVYDLLASTDELGKKKLDLSDDAKEKKITVPGSTVMPLDSLESAKEVFGTAFSNRKEAVRKCNTHSSRSHGIFIITLHGANGRTQERRDGVLHLVDLAGSERLEQPPSVDRGFKETVSINSSLTSLRDIITALSSKKDYIPYRNSKLTRLLRYAIGANAKILMIVTISPLQQHRIETLDSLRFAATVYDTQVVPAKRKELKRV